MVDIFPLHVQHFVLRDERPSMRQEHGFSTDVGSALQIDNHHHNCHTFSSESEVAKAVGRQR